MDKPHFDARYHELVRNQIEGFGRKEVVALATGRIGCATVSVELPSEDVKFINNDLTTLNG